MGRPSRVQFAGARYHVVWTAAPGRALFSDDEDRRRWLDLLAAYKKRFGLKVFAWCALDSAAHFLLETPRGDLARAMQGLATAYTKYSNARHRRDGPLLRGRYRARLVEGEKDLIEASRLIHGAPVRAGAAARAWRYAWSSCREYTSGPHRSGIIDSEVILKGFARNRLRQSVKYLQFLKETDALAASDAPAQTLSARAPTPNPGVGELLDFSGVVEEAGRRHKVDPADILSRLRTPDVSRARREVAWRAWEAGMGVTAIGAALRRTPAAVCRMVAEARRQSPSAP